jgi:hypothetical protein
LESVSVEIQALCGIGIWKQLSVGIYDAISGITRNLGNPHFHFLF